MTVHVWGYTGEDVCKNLQEFNSDNSNSNYLFVYLELVILCVTFIFEDIIEFSIPGFCIGHYGKWYWSLMILSIRPLVYQRADVPWKIPTLHFISLSWSDVYFGFYCLLGMQLELIWESTASDLKSFGVGVYELNYQYSRKLNSKLNVNHYPQFIAIVKGKIFKYSRNEFSKENLRTFVRNVLPKRIIRQVCIRHLFMIRFFIEAF